MYGMTIRHGNRTAQTALFCALVLSAGTILPPSAAAQTPGVGRVSRFEKSPEVEHSGATRELLVGDWIYAGDVVRTKKARAEFELWGGATLHLGRKTVIVIGEHDAESGRMALSIEKGYVRLAGTGLPEGAQVEVRAPGFTLTAERPDIFFRLERRLTDVVAFEGDALLSTKRHGEILLPAGHVVTFAVSERKEKIQPIPAWYEKMIKGWLSFGD